MSISRIFAFVIKFEILSFLKVIHIPSLPIFMGEWSFVGLELGYWIVSEDNEMILKFAIFNFFKKIFVICNII